LTRPPPGRPDELAGRVAAITGPTSGIGLELARGLARRGATVLLLARPSPRAAAARAELVASTGSEHLHLVDCDLADLASVRAAAERVLDRWKRLDVLCNNAGGWFPGRGLTGDGFERTFQVNHLGHYLLTELLAQRLLTAGGRVVATSSAAHVAGTVAQLDDPQGELDYSGLRAYGFAKLCNLWHVQTLAARHGAQGLLAHAFHPGGVRTRFGASAGGAMAWVFRLTWPLLTPPERAARTGLRLATADLSEAPNGSYWTRSRLARPSRAGREPAAARRLDALSRELLGLPPR
jgi:retinol dehydrogenase-12